MRRRLIVAYADTRAEMHKVLDKWLDHCVSNPAIRGEGVNTLKLDAYLVITDGQYEPIDETSEHLQFRKVAEYGAFWRITVEQRHRGLLNEDSEPDAE